MEKKIDNRRVSISKHLLKEAFIELLHKNPISKISITDICQQADVNRSTFYAHYVDTSSLLLDVEKEVLADFNRELLRGEKTLIGHMRTMYNFVKDKQKVLRVLMLNLERTKFNHDLVRTAVDRYQDKVHLIEDEVFKITYAYCSNGIIGLIKEWIIADFNYTPDQLAKISYSLVKRTISGVNIDIDTF